MRITNLSCLFLCLLLPSLASAQVAISLEVQEVYDDNIYLEDDIGAFTPELEAQISDLTEEERASFELLGSQNGDPDDDFITLINLGLNGALDIGNVAVLALDGSGGVAIFSEFDDENRWLLDSLVRLSAKEEFLPKPFSASVSSSFQSGANNIAVAEGTIARRTVQHTASLNLGISNYEVSNGTEVGLNYVFSRVDFLGELKLDDAEGLADELDPDEQGADYFSNKITASIGRDVNETTQLGFRTGVRRLDFTNVESDDFEENEEEDLDRLEWFFGLFGDSRVSEAITLSASVGGDFTFFDEDESTRTVTVTDLDGNTSTIVLERDDSDSSLFFSAGLKLAPPDAKYSFDTSVRQSSGINVDGERIVSRSVSANASLQPIERTVFLLGGTFRQFDEGDSLSDPTDRYSGTASLKFEITESMNVIAGYSYTEQESDDDLSSGFLFRSNDYDSSRAFITLNAGLAGIKS